MYCTPVESVLFKWRNASQTLIVKHKVTKMKCIANFFIVHKDRGTDRTVIDSLRTDWMSTKEYRKTSGPSYYSYLFVRFLLFWRVIPFSPANEWNFLVSFTTEEGPLRHPRTRRVLPLNSNHKNATEVSDHMAKIVKMLYCAYFIFPTVLFCSIAVQ